MQTKVGNVCIFRRVEGIVHNLNQKWCSGTFCNNSHIWLRLVLEIYSHIIQGFAAHVKLGIPVLGFFALHMKLEHEPESATSGIIMNYFICFN
jgi:hypothetical protein